MNSTQSEYTLNLASRSFSNEAKGAEAFASISKDGIALAFIPHGPTAQATAPFIVRACNSHAALVSALENALKIAEMFVPDTISYREGSMIDQLNRARAVLDQAKA